MCLETKNELVFLEFGPFQGLTDVWFRQLFQKYFSGIDLFYTPFFSGIHTQKSKNLLSPEINPDFNCTATLVPQLLSNDANEVLRFAHQVKELGYTAFNLNMGCPFPLVANKKRGSGILPYPAMVGELLEEVSDKTPLLYSIKCRLGYEHSNEIYALIPLFNRAGLSRLIVHARIGKQLYKGLPDWDTFGHIRKEIKTDLVYNGDIFSVDSFHNISKYYPEITRWMLGRGLLANPFLATDIKNPATEIDARHRLNTVYSFVQELYHLRRKQSNDNLSILGRMKEFWFYLHQSFSEQQDVWRLIRRARSFQDYEQAVQTVFSYHNWKGGGFSPKS